MASAQIAWYGDCIADPRIVLPRAGSAVDLFSARISPSACIAERVDYDTLLEHIVEYTLRAAFAHAVDQHDWEQEELRRKGLRALELFHNDRAVWQDRVAFEQSLAEVTLTGDYPRFEGANELDPELSERIDRDLQERWRLAGYLVPSLALDMKKLFCELEADAADCAREAREALMSNLLSGRTTHHRTT
jgi:hypothetical protein